MPSPDFPMDFYEGALTILVEKDLIKKCFLNVLSAIDELNGL
jgi:hypothetical protein